MAQPRGAPPTWPRRLLWDGDSRGGRMALTSLGKWLYGATFVLLLPIALAAWAAATADLVHIRALVAPTIGLTIASAGALLLILGMVNLWVYGGGLPMNAHPPPRYVAQGVFRLLPHPIYTGFSTLCAGVSIAAGSASGLWLVSPSDLAPCRGACCPRQVQRLRRVRSA